MGWFDKSEAQLAAEAATNEALAIENQEIASPFRGASIDARLQAIATVYALGGRVDGAMSGWDEVNAEKAARSFVRLMRRLNTPMVQDHSYDGPG